jgi:hypothetical protein
MVRRDFSRRVPAFAMVDRRWLAVTPMVEVDVAIARCGPRDVAGWRMVGAAWAGELKILRLRSDEDASGAGIRCRSGHGTADLPPILAKSSPFWAWNMLNAMSRRPPQNRMFARNALMLLLATVPATATATENDSQSANSIMPGCNAWLTQLSRGSTALRLQCLSRGRMYGHRRQHFPFHQRPARLRT